MRKIARYIYVGISWLALASVIFPFFLAGMSLFVNRSYWSLHADFGWGSELPLLALIVVGLLGWIPRRLTAWLVVMIVLHFVHTILPGLKNDLPMLAAVHPVSALLLTTITYLHARKAGQLLLEPRRESGVGEAQVSAEPSA